MLVEILKVFKNHIEIEPYIGESDPTENLDAFITSMFFVGATNALVYRTFPLALRKGTLCWL